MLWFWYNKRFKHSCLLRKLECYLRRGGHPTLRVTRGCRPGFSTLTLREHRQVKPAKSIPWENIGHENAMNFIPWENTNMQNPWKIHAERTHVLEKATLSGGTSPYPQHMGVPSPGRYLCVGHSNVVIFSHFLILFLCSTQVIAYSYFHVLLSCTTSSRTKFLLF